MTRRSPVIAATLAALLGGRADAGEPYHDKAHNFTVDLPDGWEAIPVAEMKRVNGRLRQRMPDLDMTFATGFRPKGATLGDLPAVLVYADPDSLDGMPFEDFQREFLKGFETGRKKAKLAGKRATVTTPEFEPEKRRFIFRGWIAGANGSVGMYAVGYAGTKHTVVLYGYAEGSAFREHTPTFVNLGDSFRFDEEPKVAGFKLPLLGQFFGESGGQTAMMAAVGLCTTGVVFAVGLLTMKGK